MIITRDKSLGGWTDFVSSGAYKAAFLNTYDQKPPAIDRFDLVGHEDMMRTNTLSMVLATKDIPESSDKLWPSLGVIAVRLTFQLKNVPFYTINFWFSSDCPKDERKMKEVCEYEGNVGAPKMITIMGALTCRASNIILTGFAPVIGR